MATTKYTDLIPEVLTYLKADPSNPVTESAIKKAVIQFCNQSWVWRHFCDPIDVVAGESTYDLEPPSGTDVAVVLHAKLDGVKIEPKSTIWLDDVVPDWNIEQGDVKYWTQVNTEQIILAKIPDADTAGGLVMTIAVQPDQRATGFPKWIGSQYLYPLVAGALYNLLMIPGEAWSDAALAQTYKAQFENGIADARNDAVSALSRAPVRTSAQH